MKVHFECKFSGIPEYLNLVQKGYTGDYKKRYANRESSLNVSLIYLQKESCI